MQGRHLAWPLCWLLLLLVATWGLPHAEWLLQPLAPEARSVLYRQAVFSDLLLSHLLLVVVAACVSIALGLGTAIAVSRPWGVDFQPLAGQAASIGQTFPPVAVLALAVPALGFGALPTLFALSLYGVLPILRNSLSGLQGVSPDVLEAARGMGLSPRQVLWQIELPLALPVILAGIRTSVTINIATAAIGSTIGASTLGDPIISGLVNGNTAYVLQGALLIGLLALAVDSLFAGLQGASQANQAERQPR